MLFNSLEFLIFLLVVYGLYRVLPFRGQNLMLLVAGYIFYGWWDWRFLFLMVVSTTLDYWVGLILDRGRLRWREAIEPAAFVVVAAIVLLGTSIPVLVGLLSGGGTAGLVTPLMQPVLLAIPVFLAVVAAGYRVLVELPEERRRKACVAISICIQLTILSTFKYFNFFVDSLVEALNTAGIAAQPRHFDIVLPVGLSFYTFQSMSYALDIYRRELKPTGHFLDFALFVAFFPQLVAGPINRARQLLPQVQNPRTLTWDDSTRGLFLIMFGLFKKVAIADGLAPTVNQIFARGEATWAEVAVATALFAVQIYADFSGYSDVARGVAKLFGFELMVNFNQPYFSRSPQEFWKRWHISLSTWLSDYLYKPLGGSRGSLAFTCRNLMLTMVLGGLWHGAAWNYVLWGFYQGLILCVHRVTVARHGPAREDSILLSAAKIAGTGVLVLYGWLLFRAHSFAQVADFTHTLLTGAGGLSFHAAMPGISAVAGTALLATWEIAQFASGGSARFYQWRKPAAIGVATAAMIFLTFMGSSNEPAQFIYFQF